MKSGKSLLCHSLVTVTLLAMAGAVVAGLVLRLWVSPDLFQYTIWSDRDLLRGLDAFSKWQVTGAELSYGPSTPGGGYYLLLGLIQAVNPSPQFVYVVQNLADSAGMLILAALAYRYAGMSVALCSAAFYALSHPVISVISQLWNPGFLGLPAALVLFATARGALEDRRAPLVAASLLTGWASQIHVSFLAYGISAVAVAILWRRREMALTAGLALAALLLAYLPYLATELATGGHEIQFFRGIQVGQMERPLMVRLRELWEGLLPWQDPVGSWATAILAGNVMVVAAVLTSVAVAVPSRRRGGSRQDLARFLLAVLIPAAVLVSVISARGGNRYYLAQVPAISVLLGLGLATLIRPIAGFGRFAALPLMVPAVGAVLFVLTAVRDPWLWSNANSWDLGMAYGRIVSVLEVVRGRYGIAGEAVEERVAVLDPGGQSWGLPPVKLSYLLRHAPGWSTVSDIGDHCVLVGIASTGAKAEQILRDELAQIEAKADEVMVLGDAAYVRYWPQSGNCRKNLKERYFLTAAETQPYQHWDELAAHSEQALSLALGTYAFRSGPALAFGGILTLHARNGRVMVRLDSNHLQGKSWARGVTNTGVILRDVALTFSPQDGAPDTTIRSDAVGELKGGRLGPWTSSTDLAPGRYRVRLTATANIPGQWQGLSDGNDLTAPVDVLIASAYSME